MSALAIAWIVAIVAASVAAKFLALVMRGRDLGMVLGPLVGIVGGVVTWQVLVLAVPMSGTDPVAAGVSAALGGAALFIVTALLRRRS
jgi:uncharacterized membrane protein YeaQ/YmgE (transglycosylase-associated protein family)